MMRDPYTTLGEELSAAATRQLAGAPAKRPRRRWRSRPGIGAGAIALALVGSAVAFAATGFLNGSPVRPERAVSPYAGNGVPVAGEASTRLALLVPDSTESLPWGLRVFNTTRGQSCVQVGRVQGGELGEIGLDSAFDNDGRFHLLPAEDLPPGYGGSSSQTECIGASETVIYENAKADRSAVRLLPEEFRSPFKKNIIPPAADLRALAYGLLGPHAVSITYRTPAGLRTAPIQAPDGAFLIVESSGRLGAPSTVGLSQGGEAQPHNVSVVLTGLLRQKSPPIVSAVTFRFGSKVCSQGTGAPVSRQCPVRRPKLAAEHPYQPTRSLHQHVGLELIAQSPATCRAGYLLDPCYKGLVTFRAPYPITKAGSDYDVNGLANCKIGGRPETSWGLERDVGAHEQIRTLSLGLFVYTPSCLHKEAFQVVYINPRGPSAAAPHASVIVGSVEMSEATGHPRAPYRR